MPFDFLCEDLQRILRERGITEPTEPQRVASPKIQEGRNILLVAPTGIGKTETAMLPVFDALYKAQKKPGIRCLYITPLRALNRDMMKRMTELGMELGVTVDVRHGDTSMSDRNRQSQHPPDIMITTPETLQVMFTGKNLINHLKNVRCVIVDEIHELSNTERGAQLSVALERLEKMSGRFQRVGLSATVGNEEEVANFLAGNGRTVEICKFDTHRDMDISVEKPEPCNDAVLQDKLQGDPEIVSVMIRARQLIEQERSTLFFVNTRETAEWLSSRYRYWDQNIPIEVHHGSLSKDIRTDTEDRFKSGQLKALICTSSLELGIDVGTTGLVIQYNSPRQVARMIQRAGRAGHRVGEMIKARIIATAPDELLEAMVIARRSESREIEGRSGRPRPYTVIANQLIAMTMKGKVTRDEAFSYFEKAYPFRGLKREEMDSVIEQLKSIKMIFEDEDGFKRSRKGMSYFYNNISMIPDERNYYIRDIATRAVIGTLDESFVATFEDDYNTFIAKGRTWRVVEQREDEILVEEARNIGAVPSWTGSDIPVPFEVAMEVGQIRRTRDYSEYKCNDLALDTVSSYLDENDRRWKMPTDKAVIIEYGEGVAIINSCFGTQVNETIGKLYSALLVSRIGESVGVSTDPYRIIIELPRYIGKDVLIDTFRLIRPGTIEALARRSILNSAFLRWRFAYVAKKFGIIEKDADHRFINFTKLFDLHKGTPAYEEAINKVLWEDLDIAKTEKAISMIDSGEIQLLAQSISRVGLEGITRSKELMQPLRADHTILTALKKRLGDEVLHATCLNCSSQWRVRVSEAPREFVCARCGGMMVALLKDYDREAVKVCGKNLDDMTADERKTYSKLKKVANLVSTNGPRAAIVLAGRGVGPETAMRILRGSYRDEDDFLREIMTAEVTFAKNKRFWD